MIKNISQVYIYNTLIEVLSQHKKWKDKRHLKTLAWMITGLIQTGRISLTSWVDYVISKAKYASSVVRRFNRWLNNGNIEVNSLYSPLIQQAISEWNNIKIYLALDTSMLWDTYCIIRISLIYRGRALPIIWKVIEHKSSSIKFDVYKELLDKAQELLYGLNCNVIFLADRGFADTKLMGHLKDMKWHFRIRIKGNFSFYTKKGHSRKVDNKTLFPGNAFFWHNIYITQQQYGVVHLAMGYPLDIKEKWFIVSDEPTNFTTFQEYGLRFDIEENFLDDKSNGFQLESSGIRNANALNRLCFVLAVTTHYLVSQGVEVVKEGKRRFVDSHWFRGKSYLKIGWSFVIQSLSKGYSLIKKLCLISESDPEPAMASKKQTIKRIKFCLGSAFDNVGCCYIR